MAIDGAGVFLPLTGGSGAWAIVQFQPMTGTGIVHDRGGTFEAMTGSGTAHGGATGAGAFEAMTGTGTCVPPVVVHGAAVFEAMTGGGQIVTGDVLFEAMTGAGVARGPITGGGVFLPMDVLNTSGAPRFAPMTGTGLAYESPGDTYDAKVLNTGIAALTEFTNYRFNSFARIGDDYYAAGPAGLVRIDTGGSDAGQPINWVVRTGQHDDKDPGLKRLPEVVLGLRSNGNITVRVHKDDNTFFDYALPAVKKTTIHQHRVKPGKGMRSRWFQVELRGVGGASLELDSLQMLMAQTKRRLG